MSDIKAGDVVELKSGSPRLTVVVVNPADESGEETAVLSWYCESSAEFRNVAAGLHVLVLVTSAD